MAVQQRRVSKTRKNKRRSHHALIVATSSKCKNCGTTVIPHRVCKSCHNYGGVNVLKR